MEAYAGCLHRLHRGHRAASNDERAASPIDIGRVQRRANADAQVRGAPVLVVQKIGLCGAAVDRLRWARLHLAADVEAFQLVRIASIRERLLVVAASQLRAAGLVSEVALERSDGDPPTALGHR